jgi:hypothetical protein
MANGLFYPGLFTQGEFGVRGDLSGHRRSGMIGHTSLVDV